MTIACTNNADQNQSAKSQAYTKEKIVKLSEEQRKSLEIRIGSPLVKSINGVIKANGMLDVPPQNIVTIAAPLGGFVKSTALLQGMKVKKGQTVVVLEHPEYIQMQEDYLSNKNQLEFLEKEYTRQQELAKENVNAAKALQQAKSNYYATEAKVKGLKAKLKLININPLDLEKGDIKNTISIPSPISGFVTQMNVNIGAHVNPMEVMFKIIDTEHIHAEAQVFEKEIARLKIGQKVRIKLSNESKERQASVFLIGKEISAQRTVLVHCHLDQEDVNLIPGLYFSARIETDSRQATTLPREAIVEFDNKQYVFIEVPEIKNEFEMVEIKIGQALEDFVEISLPTNMNSQKIVLKGTYALLSILKNTEE